MIIKCIDDNGVDEYVTKNSEYEAEIYEHDDGFFRTDVCDDGGIVLLNIERFEIVID